MVDKLLMVDNFLMIDHYLFGWMNFFGLPTGLFFHRIFLIVLWHSSQTKPSTAHCVVHKTYEQNKHVLASTPGSSFLQKWCFTWKLSVNETPQTMPIFTLFRLALNMLLYHHIIGWKILQPPWIHVHTQSIAALPCILFLNHNKYPKLIKFHYLCMYSAYLYIVTTTFDACKIFHTKHRSN